MRGDVAGEDLIGGDVAEPFDRALIRCLVAVNGAVAVFLPLFLLPCLRDGAEKQLRRLLLRLNAPVQLLRVAVADRVPRAFRQTVGVELVPVALITAICAQRIELL